MFILFKKELEENLNYQIRIVVVWISGTNRMQNKKPNFIQTLYICLFYNCFRKILFWIGKKMEHRKSNSRFWFKPNNLISRMDWTGLDLGESEEWIVKPRLWFYKGMHYKRRCARFMQLQLATPNTEIQCLIPLTSN